MKTVTRVKTINGNDYLYEVTYYYDPVEKRSKQKSKYLGKYVDGEPVKAREQAKYPKTVYNLGEFLLYRQARLKLELDALLRTYFTATEIKIIFSIAYAGLTDQNAFYNPSGWYQSTIMYMRNPSLKFDLETITKVLQKIGDSEIPSSFSQDMLNFSQTRQTTVYDINISTGIRNSELYNDSIANIEQNYENITLIYDSKINLPVYYIHRNYPLPRGASPKEIRTTLTSLDVSIKGSLLIQNKNEYTQLNLHELQSAHIPYLLPIPVDAYRLKEIQEENQIMLLHHDNVDLYNNNLIFTVPFTTTIYDKPMKGYLYCEPQKGIIEKKQISENVLQICKRLEQTQVYDGMNPAEIIQEIAGKYEPFIKYQVEGKKINATLKPRTVAMKEVGVFAILYSGNIKWDKCLSHYDKQAEDCRFLIQFMEMKQALPYSVHTQAITKGLLFVSYLSLLLRRWAVNEIKQSELTYTPEDVLLELKKIKLIEYTKKKSIHTKVSAKQMEILTALDMQIEY